MTDLFPAFTAAIGPHATRYALEQHAESKQLEHGLLASAHILAWNIIAATARNTGYADRNPSRPMPEIEFHLVDDPSMNAFAMVTADRKHNFIAVNSGAVLLTFDLFYRILANPETFKGVGDPTVGAPGGAPPGIFANYDDAVRARGSQSSIASVCPGDPVRREYAERLGLHAIGSIVLHELCHIRHGHCDLALARGLPLISESRLGMLRLGGRDYTRAELQMVQAFEHDADAFPACAAFGAHYGGDFEKDRLLDRLSATASVRPSLDSFALRRFAFDWWTAMFWTFGLIGYEESQADVSEMTHLPAAIRLVEAGATAEAWLQHHDAGTNLLEVFGDAAADAVKQAWGYLKETNVADVPAIRAAFKQTLRVKEHVERLASQWTAIRSELLPFSYVTTLAP